MLEVRLSRGRLRRLKAEQTKGALRKSVSLVLQIVHGLVEGNTLGRLDGLGFGIVVQDVAQRTREAKEDPSTRVDQGLAGSDVRRRKGVYATTEDA
jgi:hypothetical protein